MSQPNLVCAECIDEPGIRMFIKQRQKQGNCHYCENTSDIAVMASFDEVAEHIQDCIRLEYDNAQEHFAWDKEVGYWGEWWDTEDLLVEEIQLDLNDDPDGNLLKDLVASLPEYAWCEVSGYGLNDYDKTTLSWEHFCEVVTHQRRFFFMGQDAEPDNEADSPSMVLGKIFDYAEQLRLFKYLPAGTNLFRARWQAPGDQLKTVSELGPPPKELATQSNRMSPPGVVMFYACEEPETALAETAKEAGVFVVGQFTTLRKSVVLDLSNLPEVPSLFEPIHDTLPYFPQKLLLFLHLVVSEMSRPIQRDDRIHLEYIPTQIITEYIRSRRVSDVGDNVFQRLKVDGIKYPSAVRPNHSSYVFFADGDNFLVGEPDDDKGDKWLKLVGSKPYPVP